MNRHLGEHLAVDIDVLLLQSIHKGRIVGAVFAASRVNTGNPQLTELAFTLFASDVGILQRFDNRLFSHAIELGFCSEIAFRLV